MKIYNPFKLHIIESNKKFYVRRLKFKRLTFIWQYLDDSSNPIFWDAPLHFIDLLDAKTAIKNYPKIIEERKQKHKIIHHECI